MKSKYEIIFEVNKHDVQTIEQIKSTLAQNNIEILDTDVETNGINGTEIVAIVVALIPTLKDIIIAVWPKKTVSIKISSEDFGATEITASSIQQLEETVDKYLSIVKKVRDSGAPKDDN